jgi:hypothetical protein
MSINNTAYINAGKPKIGGAIFTAPLGTAIPTNADAELAAAFKCTGFVTEDGVSDNMTRSTKDVKAWGGDTVMRIQTAFGDEFKWNFLQTNDPDVLAAIYGEGNVTGTPETGMTLTVNSQDVPNRIWVIDMVLKDGGKKRLVIPNGSATMSGEIKYADSDAVNYPITVGALPDTAGNTHYEYTKSGSASSIPDTTLSSLAIGGVTLVPDFHSQNTSYTAATTSATNTITAAATDNSATVVIKNGSDTVTSGEAAEWTAGTNNVTVTVTKGGYTRTYNVTVTKS